jgi:hypothetical protein
MKYFFFVILLFSVFSCKKRNINLDPAKLNISFITDLDSLIIGQPIKIFATIENSYLDNRLCMASLPCILQVITNEKKYKNGKVELTPISYQNTNLPSINCNEKYNCNLEVLINTSGEFEFKLIILK